MLTCKIKSIGKLKYTYILIVSWFLQYHCQIVIYGVTQCMWKKEATTLQFHKSSKKNQTHIIFSLLQVKKSTHTHIHTHKEMYPPCPQNYFNHQIQPQLLNLNLELSFKSFLELSRDNHITKSDKKNLICQLWLFVIGISKKEMDVT